MSFYQYFNVPDAIIVFVFTIGAYLLLNTFFPGQKIGSFTFPPAQSRKRKVYLVSGLCLLILSGIGLAPLWEDPSKNPLKIATLDDTEREEAIQSIQSISKSSELKPGKARFSTLKGYFENANPKIFARFQQIKKQHDEGKDIQGATYVAGQSGVGKTYLVEQFKFPADKISLQKHFKAKKPDLQSIDGVLCFNTLIASKEEGDESVDLKAMIGPSPKPFVLLDDLDEIHDATAEAVLRAVEEYVADPNNPHSHFIVFGRPEGFSSWLNNPKRKKNAPNAPPNPFVLNGPRYITEGDARFLCDDAHKYDNNQQSATKELLQAFVKRLKKHPFIMDSVRPLATRNFVVQDTKYCIQKQIKKSKRELQRGLLSDLLKRNSKSHNRPTTDDDIYISLLKAAAEFPFMNDRKISPDGFFEVLEQDHIEFFDKGAPRKIRLKDLLSRSGIAFLDPAEMHRPHFRFEPFWVHEYLLSADKPFN